MHVLLQEWGNPTCTMSKPLQRASRSFPRRVVLSQPYEGLHTAPCIGALQKVHPLQKAGTENDALTRLLTLTPSP